MPLSVCLCLAHPLAYNLHKFVLWKSCSDLSVAQPGTESLCSYSFIQTFFSQNNPSERVKEVLDMLHL